MKIAVVLPFNNPFSYNKTKPVVLSALGYIKYSSFLSDITVISPYTKTPLSICNCVVVDSSINSSAKYISHVLQILQEKNFKHVEVHQNLAFAAQIAKQLDIRVFLIKHGDYLVNKCKESFSLVRFYYWYKYLRYISKVCTISNYVKDHLLKLYPQLSSKIVVTPNGYGHLENYSNVPSGKRNVIIFAGKLINKKGIFQFMDAIAGVLNTHEDWDVKVIGGVFSHKKKYVDKFYNLIFKSKFDSLIKRNRLKIYYGLTNKEVFAYMRKSKIVVVPSVYEEPFGLVALEGHMAGCAVVTSGTGGLLEISNGYGLVLPKVTSVNIANALYQLIDEQQFRQSLAYFGYYHVKDKFDPYLLASSFDKLRSRNE